MPADTYQQALDAAQTELSDLTARRAELDERIARLTETVRGLSYLVGHDASAGTLGLGLTDAIRKVLSASGRQMSPVDIRGAMELAGFDIYKYTDIIPSIHAILKRLYESKEVVIVKPLKEESNKKWYLWNEPEAIVRVRKEIEEEGGGVILIYSDPKTQNASIVFPKSSQGSSTVKKRATSRLTGRGGEEPTPTLDSSSDFVGKARNSRMKKR
jgi:hypothetical protein